jgi:hypothetical protein
MSFYNQDNHTAVEGFIMKWTLITVYIGVTLIFIVKILQLLSLYIVSGKFVGDFAKYIWQALKTTILGG